MEEFANSAFTDGRSPTTFELQMLKDKVQRREIGMRLKQLRERSPFSQKVLAQEMGITTRHYQNWENPGTGDFETVERIAKLHWERWAKDDPQWAFVSAGWIWDGKDRRETADVMSQLNGDSLTMLKEIRSDVKGIIRRLDAASAQERARAAGAPPLGKPRERKRSSPKPGEGRRASDGKQRGG